MLSHGVDFCKLQARHLEPEGYRPESVSYHSASLEVIKSSLCKKHRPRILNIAPLAPGFFNFVAPMNPLLLNFDPDVLPYRDYLELIDNSKEVFDLILVWDRLLYLSTSESRTLVTAISNHSTKGSGLLAYSTVRHTLPALPSKFSLDSNSRVNVSPQTMDTVSCENHEMLRSLPGWKCHHSVQLRNSFREHLFVRE